MYCSNCGNKLNGNEDVCLKCGVMAKNGTTNNTEDKPLVILNVLSLLNPIVGLILYLCMKNSTPNRAKKCGKYALIGAIVLLIIFIIVGIILFVVLHNVGNSRIAKYSDNIRRKAIEAYNEENKVDCTCYNLYELEVNYDYVGSVSVCKEGFIYIVKTYITNDDVYFRAEYINNRRTNFSSISNSSSTKNLYCVN